VKYTETGAHKVSRAKLSFNCDGGSSCPLWVLGCIWRRGKLVGQISLRSAIAALTILSLSPLATWQAPLKWAALRYDPLGRLPPMVDGHKGCGSGECSRGFLRARSRRVPTCRDRRPQSWERRRAAVRKVPSRPSDGWRSWWPRGRGSLAAHWQPEGMALHDTASFAVHAIRRWWRTMVKEAPPPCQTPADYRWGRR